MTTNRFLTIDGTTTEEYGLTMLEDSEPYHPAPVQSRIVEIAGSSRHIDATEFSTGHPEYGAVTDEKAEFLVDCALLEQPDTRANREAIVLAFVRAVHGQACGVVDSLHPLHTMECRCSVDVVEDSDYRLVELSWTRQALRLLDGGELEIEAGTPEQLEFDPDTAVGPFMEEPDGFDYTEAGFCYELVEERPSQPVSAGLSVSFSSSLGGVDWNADTFTASTSRLNGTDFDVQLDVANGATGAASVEVAVQGLSGNVGPFWVELHVYDGSTRVDYADTRFAASGYGTVGPVSVPAGLGSVRFHVSVYRSTQADMTVYAEIGLSDAVADIEDTLQPYRLLTSEPSWWGSLADHLLWQYATVEERPSQGGVLYGESGFDYTGYYEYVDGEGMLAAGIPATTPKVLVVTQMPNTMWFYAAFDRPTWAGPIAVDLSGNPTVTVGGTAAPNMSWDLRGSYNQVVSEHPAAYYGDPMVGELDANMTFSVPYRWPSWQLGKVHTASDAPLSLSDEFLSLYPSPTFVTALFWADAHVYGDPDFDYEGYYEYVDGMGMVPSDDISTTSGLTTEYHLTSSDFTQSGGNWTATVDVSALGGYDPHMCHMEDSVPAIMYSLDTSSSGSVGITAWDGRPTGVTLVVDKAVPEWQLGKVHTASESPLPVSDEFLSLYPSPTFAAGLWLASYAGISLTEEFDSETGYPSPLSVEASHDCTVELGGRIASVPSDGVYLTDLLVDRGENEVTVEAPSTYDPDTGAFNEFSCLLTWRRADL